MEGATFVGAAHESHGSYEERLKMGQPSSHAAYRNGTDEHSPVGGICLTDTSMNQEKIN